ALRQLIQSWHPRTAADSGHQPPAVPVPVPAMLAHLYELARGRPHVLGVQNFIHPPDELRLDASGRLEFGYENQGGFTWTLDHREPDPAVWTHGLAQEALREREPLSGFLLQYSLYEAAISAPHGARTQIIPVAVAERLTRTLQRVPLQPWIWPLYQMTFHVAPGLIANLCHHDEDHCWLAVGAAHRSLLRPLADLDIPWTGFDG
ncbi:hypothetical protein ACSNOI_42825, partial [Actinomadura kijaniata]|uniref:hypothetical protein n=1 Tax=Actinomadura kijaniata TaxID=46161 RepID=UPI003F1BB58A